MACGQRIVIIGSSGSGKTTLARQLAAYLDLPHIELDQLYWQPKWIPTPYEEFRARVVEAISGERWIVDGNYLKLRDLIWCRADTIIWLDYKIPVVWRRLGRRTLVRLFKRQTLWNGNKKVWRAQFLSRNSYLRTYRKRRKELPQLLTSSEYEHLTIVRLKSPRITKNWLKQFDKNPRPRVPLLKRVRIRRRKSTSV